jgi:MFS family permease
MQALLYGLGIGFSMHVAPVYIAEIAPKGARGAFVAAHEVAVVLGISLGFFCSFVTAGIGIHGWRLSFLPCGVFALVMQIGIAFVPQSPRYLVLNAVRAGGILGAQDRPMNQAREALKFFRGVSLYQDIEGEIQEIYQDCSEVFDPSAFVVHRVARVTDVLTYKAPLLIGCGMVFCQQVTGQPSVLFFATDIFKDAGLGNWAPFSSVLVGLVKLIATLFAVRHVDRFGRRVLLFLGIGMMVIALGTLSLAFLFRQCRDPAQSVKTCDMDNAGLPQEWALATVAGLMLYACGFQIGFGTISRLLLSEVFPLNVRGAAISIAVLFNLAINVTMNLTQEVLLMTLSPSGLFFGYACLSLLSILFVWQAVPETLGKSLEQITGDLTGRAQEEQVHEQERYLYNPQCGQSITSVSTVDTLSGVSA